MKNSNGHRNVMEHSTEQVEFQLDTFLSNLNKLEKMLSGPGSWKDPNARISTAKLLYEQLREQFSVQPRSAFGPLEPEISIRLENAKLALGSKQTNHQERGWSFEPRHLSGFEVDPVIEQQKVNYKVQDLLKR